MAASPQCIIQRSNILRWPRVTGAFLSPDSAVKSIDAEFADLHLDRVGRLARADTPSSILQSSVRGMHFIWIVGRIAVRPSEQASNGAEDESWDSSLNDPNIRHWAVSPSLEGDQRIDEKGSPGTPHWPHHWKPAQRLILAPPGSPIDSGCSQSGPQTGANEATRK